MSPLPSLGEYMTEQERITAQMAALLMAINPSLTLAKALVILEREFGKRNN
jgi:hypothetical protein